MGKSSTWQELVSKTQEAIAQSDLELARTCAFEALSLAETFPPDDRRQGVALELVTSVLYLKKQYQSCQPFLVRLLEMYKRCLGPEHIDTASIMHNLALLYHHCGKLEEADVHYLKAVKIKSAALGVEHPDVQQLTADYVDLRKLLAPLEAVSKAFTATLSDTLHLTGQFREGNAELTDVSSKS